MLTRLKPLPFHKMIHNIIFPLDETDLGVGDVVDVGGGGRGRPAGEVDGPAVTVLPPLHLRPVAVGLRYAVRLVLSNEQIYFTSTLGLLFYLV